MRYRIFGERTGLKVSEIVLGAGMFGTAFGYGAPQDEVRRLLQGYVEAGGNFIDTADNYQLGESERLIGEFIAQRRDDFVIASKFSRGATRAPALAALGNNRKAMVQSVEDSLKRLKTDRIDVYFVHMDDGVTPVDEIARGSMTSCARARSSMGASPTSLPGGSLPRPTRPTCAAGRLSPPSRSNITSLSARPSASSCPWQTASAWV